LRRLKGCLNVATVERREAKRLAAQYTALHEGIGPRGIEPTRITVPEQLVALGHVTNIVYKKRVPEQPNPRKAPKYHHPFKGSAQPLLAADPKTGRLYFIGGKYTTTSRGIEDMGTNIPRSARFSAFENPRRSRRRRKSHKSKGLFSSFLANPPADKKKSSAPAPGSTEEFLMRLLRAGASAAAFEVVTDVALNQTTWAPTTRGTVQGVAGILLALALHKQAPNAAIGVAVTGLVDIVKGGVEDYRVQAYLRQLMASTPATTSTPASSAPSTPATGTPPAGFVFEPKGLAFSRPAGFAPPQSSAAGAAYDMSTAAACAR
jgi:hypothetical protein